MSTREDALHATDILRQCLLEAGDDTASALAAAEYLLTDAGRMEAALATLDQALARMQPAYSAAMSLEDKPRPTMSERLYHQQTGSLFDGWLDHVGAEQAHQQQQQQQQRKQQQEHMPALKARYLAEIKRAAGE